MIKITDKAVAKISSMLVEKGQQDHGIRIGARGEARCGMNYYLGIQKAPLSDDKVYEWGGITIIMDPISVDRMMDVELDYVETSQGSGFVFRNRSNFDPDS